MKHLIIVIALLATFTMQAQDIRKVGPFDELVIKGKLEVYLEKGDTEQIIIEGMGDDEDELNISLQGRELKLSLIDGWIKEDRRLRLRVQYLDLSKIRVLAGAILDSREILTGDRLEIKAGSGADVELKIEVNTLEASAIEGAQLELSGTADAQYVSTATGGQYDASQLSVDRTEVRANTGGEARVVANVALDATANTGGVIRYSGDPEEKYTKSNLAGEIRRY
jgi:hypothetical protein